jgi:hypothetical protein
MSRWHDWIDWIGGFPYERATINQIVDRYAVDGFRLSKLFDCSDGYGCNEFVCDREAPAGTFVHTPMSGGTSFARRFGSRILRRSRNARVGFIASAAVAGLSPGSPRARRSPLGWSICFSAPKGSPVSLPTRQDLELTGCRRFM